MKALYPWLWSVHQGGVFAALDQSLDPSPPTLLYELAATMGLSRDDQLLDVGCGRGNHSCELARRFECRVTGLDPVASNLAQGRATAIEHDLTDRVTFQQGQLEAIPCADETIDFLWCRDMLVHVADVAAGLRECARVLRPAGAMLLFTTFATELMEPKEMAYVCQPLGVKVENLSAARVEQIFQEAGLEIISRQSIGGELIEYYEEHQGRYARELMRLARMVRARDRFVAELGQERYDTALALYRWGIYLLLGKLSSSIYVLRKSGQVVHKTYLLLPISYSIRLL
jgi:ubiquinone/menaquinone biosynthesis C-methylase UbiE